MTPAFQGFLAVAVIVVVMLVLPACSNQSALDRAAQRVVDEFCEADPISRHLIRLRADAATAPHTVRVQCGDEP